MKKTFLAMAFLLAWSASAVFAGPPQGPNVYDGWLQNSTSELENVRIFYGYSSSAENFYCRIDYFYDGRIHLLALQSYVHLSISDAPIRSILTWYSLRPIKHGYELARSSYQEKISPDINIIYEPVLPPQDLFGARCVPLLDELFAQIPAPEAALWKKQYGAIFRKE